MSRFNKVNKKNISGSLSQFLQLNAENHFPTTSSCPIQAFSILITKTMKQLKTSTLEPVNSIYSAWSMLLTDVYYYYFNFYLSRQILLRLQKRLFKGASVKTYIQQKWHHIKCTITNSLVTVTPWHLQEGHINYYKVSSPINKAGCAEVPHFDREA